MRDRRPDRRGFTMVYVWVDGSGHPWFFYTVLSQCSFGHLSSKFGYYDSLIPSIHTVNFTGLAIGNLNLLEFSLISLSKIRQ